jgi:phenylacetate-coenzyme A ligase PaaK-like adenylate-forming protein
MPDIDPIALQARRAAQRRMPQLMARIDWPRARLDEHRERALRAVLAHAIEGSAWHRERLAGIDVERFRVEDLPSLPTMTKADLMSGFDHIATDARVTVERCEEHLESGDLLMDGDLVAFASGGTSGVRAIGVESVDTLAEAWVCGMPRFVMRWVARTRRIPRFVLPLVTRLRARRGPPSMVGIGAAPGPHASFVLRSLFAGGAHAGFSVLDPIDDIVAGLNERQPDHLAAYSSFFPRLVDEAHRGRLRIGPRMVTAVAEPLLPEHTEAIAEVWDCVVVSSWGATEVTGLGAGSGFEPGMLLLDDRHIIEPVDQEGRPVGPGERASKIFVTPLWPRVLPLVRYEITDQVTVLEGPAACGSSFTRVANVEGRLDDQFVYQGGVSVHPHLFRAVLGRRRAITEYQVAQTARGAEIRVVLASGAERLDEARVIQELRDLLGAQGVRDADITLEIVTEIPRHERSMKLKRFVPLTTAVGSVHARGARA